MENMLGNKLGTWGTNWELEKNIVQTHWEPGKNEKKNPSPPPPPPHQTWNENKQGTLSACLGLPIIGYMKFVLPKRVGHHFWPGLITPCKEQHPTYSTHGWLGAILMPWVNQRRIKWNSMLRIPNFVVGLLLNIVNFIS